MPNGLRIGAAFDYPLTQLNTVTVRGIRDNGRLNSTINRKDRHATLFLTSRDLSAKRPHHELYPKPHSCICRILASTATVFGQFAKLKRAAGDMQDLNYSTAIELYQQILEDHDVAEAKINWLSATAILQIPRMQNIGMAGRSCVCPSQNQFTSCIMCAGTPGKWKGNSRGPGWRSTGVAPDEGRAQNLLKGLT